MRWNARKNYHVISYSNHRIEIGILCPKCKENLSRVSMNYSVYKFWKSNTELIQNIFPEISKQTREILISGLCLDCQKEVFDND